MEYEEFMEAVGRYREWARNLGDILAAHGEESPWQPHQDPAFWRTLDAIEAAGAQRDEARVGFLMGLALIDDLGPMGRGMILAKASLLAVQRMPAVARRAILALPPVPDDAPRYRKIGLLKLIEAASFAQVPPPLRTLSADADPEIRRRANDLMSRLAGDADASSPS